MKSKRFVAVALLLGGIACATRSAPTTTVGDAGSPPTAVLIVQLLGLESDVSQVAVALYDSADSFENRSGAVATEWIKPQDRVASWTVEGLVPGDYAVAVFHDLNGNGQLDRSALGLPSEPYGFSSDARGAFGPPKYANAAIRIGPGTSTIEITLR